VNAKKAEKFENATPDFIMKLINQNRSDPEKEAEKVPPTPPKETKLAV